MRSVLQLSLMMMMIPNVGFTKASSLAATALKAPTALKYTVSSKNLTLSWKAPLTTLRVRYRIHKEKTGGKSTFVASTLGLSFTELLPKTQTRYLVDYIDSNGRISPSARITFTPIVTAPVPVPPTPPAPTPVPPTPIPTPVTGYPSYFPMDGLKKPVDVRLISCAKSNAAGALRDINDKAISMATAPLYEGIEFVYEAPCTYKNMGPASIRNWKWADGAQVIHRTSIRGQKAIFSSADQWTNLSFKPGAVGRRFHGEVTDIELRLTGNVQSMGSLHFEVYPNASEGKLATLVVRDSVIEGGKNALFIPGGASMLYVENTKIGRNVGSDVEQQHSIYINGTLSTHFKDSFIYGQNAKGSYGGHILKNKSAIRILENVTLSNEGGQADLTNRALGDFSSFGYTFSDGLKLIRKLPQSPRTGIVHLRSDRYFTGESVNLPFLTATGAKQPALPPGCNNPLDNINEAYWHVFKNTVVNSEVDDKHIFEMNGVVDTAYNGIHALTSYADIIANPQRNRAVLLTFNTETRAPAVSTDGYSYGNPRYPTYHCEDLNAGPNLEKILANKDAFLRHAFGRVWSANPGIVPLPKF
jgi:hypothetical protein